MRKINWDTVLTYCFAGTLLFIAAYVAVKVLLFGIGLII